MTKQQIKKLIKSGKRFKIAQAIFDYWKIVPVEIKLPYSNE